MKKMRASYTTELAAVGRRIFGGSSSLRKVPRRVQVKKFREKYLESEAEVEEYSLEQRQDRWDEGPGDAGFGTHRVLRTFSASC